MALYLTRFSYTPETWARLIKRPEDRREAPLLTVEETLDALGRAQAVAYRPPGS